ncbi:MAG: ATP-binding protein [Bacillota bacterium]|uniref:ATP-binding protein n=1 Tax=Desulforudis sp. DRI-14 TaxID=3459793 RepID=UPI00346BD281
MNLPFFPRNLRFQIPVIIAAILIVPVLVMLYDIVFASKTDQILLVNKEQHLATMVRFLSTNISKDIEGKTSGLSDSEQTVMLRDAFNKVAVPLASENPGVRLGLYVPSTDHLFVQGFLHQYRKLDPEEEALREQRIFREAKSGIAAVVGSHESLARIAGSPDDQFFEHLVPIFDGDRFVAVAWAEERLNPIFLQSRNFRMVTRYLTLLGFLFGAVGTLMLVTNLSRRVSLVKDGLNRLEKNIHDNLPEIPGEMGEIAKAINKMALALAEKEKLEEQLRRSENLAALGRLVTGVAHELRNPAGIIKATIQVMEKEYRHCPEFSDYARVIKEQVDRQNKVLTELLEFGRPSRNVVQPLNLNTLLQGVLTFTEPLLRQRGIKLETAFDPALPPVEGDGEKMKQVFVNLILNAVQAMPQGGILNIVTCLTSRGVAVSFHDNGTGIPAEDIPHIFDPFFTTKEGGSGLGLAISRQIIDLHGGNIEVQSSPGQGSTFNVILPPAKEGHGDGSQYSDH